MASSTTNAGEGVVFFDNAKSLSIPSFGNEGDITLRSLASGAGSSAWRYAEFFDSVCVRHRLWIQDMGCLVGGKAFVKRIGQFDGANLCAIPTPDTFFNINISGLSAKSDLEISGLALEILNFGVEQKVNV
jgi:hypothetical protein